MFKEVIMGTGPTQEIDFKKKRVEARKLIIPDMKKAF